VHVRLSDGSKRYPKSQTVEKIIANVQSASQPRGRKAEAVA
jgi:hypothetical protein